MRFLQPDKKDLFRRTKYNHLHGAVQHETLWQQDSYSGLAPLHLLDSPSGCLQTFSGESQLFYATGQNIFVLLSLESQSPPRGGQSLKNGSCSLHLRCADAIQGSGDQSPTFAGSEFAPAESMSFLTSIVDTLEFLEIQFTKETSVLFVVQNLSTRGFP